MPLDGNGAYELPAPEWPAIGDTTILATDYNTILSDVAEALSLALYKDGQTVVEADLDLGGFKITNLANGVASQDAATVLQTFTSPVFTDAEFGGDSFKIDVDALTITATSINLNGLTEIELSYLEGVTSSLQPQLDLKAPLASPVLTGAPTAPSPGLSDAATRIATVATVNSLAFTAGDLPDIAGHPGEGIYTDGTLIFWSKLGLVYAAGATTLLQGNSYMLDATAGSFSVTLSASPAVGDSIELRDAFSSWGDNPVTVVRSGNNFLDESGAAIAEDLVLDVPDQELTIVYTSLGWRLT